MSIPSSFYSEAISTTTLPVKESSISWSAIFAGAIAALVISFLLALLGFSLGLSSFSFWPYYETHVTTFTMATAIWLIVMQWLSAGFGGYIAGRLRTHDLGLGEDELFFRDTVHGFLTWAISTLFMLMMVVCTANAAVRGGTEAAMNISSSSISSSSSANQSDISDTTGYTLDYLFRMSTGEPLDEPNPPFQNIRAETVRILGMGLKEGTLRKEDKDYLTQLIAAHTHVEPAEATRRIDTVLDQLNHAKEKARQLSLRFSIYALLSLVVGAFIASASGALGGKHRIEY